MRVRVRVGVAVGVRVGEGERGSGSEGGNVSNAVLPHPTPFLASHRDVDAQRFASVRDGGPGGRTRGRGGVWPADGRRGDEGGGLCARA